MKETAFASRFDARHLYLPQFCVCGEAIPREPGRLVQKSGSTSIVAGAGGNVMVQDSTRWLQDSARRRTLQPGGFLVLGEILSCVRSCVIDGRRRAARCNRAASSTQDGLLIFGSCVRSIMASQVLRDRRGGKEAAHCGLSKRHRHANLACY